MSDNSKMPPIVKAIVAVVIAAMVMRVILAIITHNDPESILYIAVSVWIWLPILLIVGVFTWGVSKGDGN
jgi:hypothetical protein